MKFGSPIKMGSKRNRFSLVVSWLVLTASVFLLTSCGKNAAPASKSSTSRTLAASTSEPTSLLTVGTVESTTTPRTASTVSSAADEQPFEAEVASLEQQAQKVYYGIHYFNSKREFTSHNSEPTTSASVIKAFILAYALDQVAAGNLTETTMIEDKPLQVWLTPMIQVSDNVATNVLIDHFGMAALNDYFTAQGYSATRLERKMLDTAARAAGKENYTSLNDCLLLLQRIYEGQSQPMYQEMLTLLKGQQVKTKIPSRLPATVVTANKTGELAEVENDIGIVFSENDPFAIVVLTNEIANSEAVQQGIGELALAAYQKSLAPA